MNYLKVAQQQIIVENLTMDLRQSKKNTVEQTLKQCWE